MPAQIVLVHDDPDFNISATLALTVAGYGVAPFVDPVVALNALEAARTVEVLVTDIRFGPDKPHGLALARTARRMRPDIRVLFTAAPELAPFAVGLGDFIAVPVTPTHLVEGVRRLLTAAADFRPY
jgi:DNA-binding NtrC family response regulator